MVKRRNEPPSDRLLIWVRRLGERKNRNVAAVAMAAKLARIAWALIAKGETYRPCPIAAAPPAA
jgi:transposase